MQEINKIYDDIVFKEVFESTANRALVAYTVGIVSLKKASRKAKEIIDEGEANGVVLDAFLRMRNAV